MNMIPVGDGKFPVIIETFLLSKLIKVLKKLYIVVNEKERKKEGGRIKCSCKWNVTLLLKIFTIRWYHYQLEVN